MSHIAGTIPLGQWSARRNGRYLHNKQKTQETNTHAISGNQTRDSGNQAPQTYALGRTATVISLSG
jgi:hypothetical protein